PDGINFPTLPTTYTITITNGDPEFDVDFGFTGAECSDLNLLDIVVCSENDNGEDVYNASIEIFGGVGPYNVLATVNGDIVFEGTVENIIEMPAILDGLNYELTVTDAQGCEQFLVGPTVPCETVPIELIDFVGEVQREGNMLEWFTATELNNNYYTLQRSIDGINFETITTVDAAGTTTNTSSYDYLDRNAPAGLSYYRLLQTDFDGTTTDAGLVKLTRTGITGLAINFVGPIPAKETVSVTFDTDEDEVVTLQIFNMAGQAVYTQTIDAQNGLNTMSIELGNQFSAGVYLIQLNDGETNVQERMIKQ
ncbi:MAG: T9SS type A sorting domain-containing protein, partial [Chitinophagales bacterium]